MPEQLIALSTLLILNFIVGIVFTVLPFWFICKKLVYIRHYQSCLSCR